MSLSKCEGTKRIPLLRDEAPPSVVAGIRDSTGRDVRRGR